MRPSERARSATLTLRSRRDLAALAAAYATATDMANQLHCEASYPYVVWERPLEPPTGLDLGQVAP